MLNILFFIDSLGPGGAQRQMVTLAKLFSEQGYDVKFLVYDDSNFFKPLLNECNIPVHNIRANTILNKILKIRKFIRGGMQDVVISFLDTPNFLACVAAVGNKKWKLIISERSNPERQAKSVKNKIYRLFYRYAEAIVCNSNIAKKIWMDTYPEYSSKLTTIYNTVTLLDVKNIYIPKRNNKINLVIAASYQYLKNPVGFVKALCLLNEKERDKIKIDWYGSKNVSDNGSAYTEAIQLIDKNNLGTIINLNASILNITEKFYEADIVGLFSKYEGLPNVICEAMMLGKPVMMTRVSDYTVLVDENNGFLCDWDKPETIKNALITAINLSECDLKQMGENSKQKAEKLFQSETITEQWLNLIN